MRLAVFMMALTFIALCIACSGEKAADLSGDNEWTESGSDSDNTDQNPATDGDRDWGGEEFLFRFDSRVPGERNISLTMRLTGSYNMDYNKSGLSTFDKSIAGSLTLAQVAEISGYLETRLESLNGDYIESGVDCLSGSALYAGPNTRELSWNCSLDDDLLAFLNYMHHWIDTTILAGQPDGDLDDPAGDGDLDQTDGDNEIDDEADLDPEICEAPEQEYEGDILLDFAYRRSGVTDRSLWLYGNRIYRLEVETPQGGLRVDDGLVPEAEFDSFARKVADRAYLAPCRDENECESGVVGHVYWYGDAANFTDYDCPENDVTLDLIQVTNDFIDTLLNVPDGDLDDEAEADDSIVCDDGNPCTVGTWNTEAEQCMYNPLPDNMLCNDRKPGTQNDRCNGGICAGINPDCQDWPLNAQGYCETNIMGNANDKGSMVFLPANAFRQGFTESECNAQSCADAKPAHTTSLTHGVWVDAFEVTEQGYYEFAQDTPIWQTNTSGENPCGSSYGEFSQPPEPGHEQRPVASICWHAAQAYCRWTGKRMLTEAEWEYGARGPNSNPEGRRYPWGDTEPSCELANFGDRNGDGANTDPCWNHPIWVGSYNGENQTQNGTSLFTLHDLAGNVAEWVFDAFTAYSADEITNPVVKTGGLRVVRGGSFSDAELRLRGAFRENLSQIAAADTVGFRCAAPKFDLDRDGIATTGTAPCQPGEQFYCADNCPTVPNSGQENDDGNYPGDACEDTPPATLPCTDLEWAAEDLVDESLSLPTSAVSLIDDATADDAQALQLSAAGRGDQIVLLFTLDQDFSGSLKLRFKSTTESGTLRLFMDTPLARALTHAQNGYDPLDLYASELVQWFEATYAVGSLSAGTHRLVIKVMGRNPESSGYDVAVDTLQLTCPQ